jgi:hypothetical protein
MTSARKTAGFATAALIFAVSCGPSSAPQSIDLSSCLSQYHPVAPDPMPAAGPTGFFTGGVTYAAPCPALTDAGTQLWSVVVVAHDDKTVRVYFVGGTMQDRCGLLRSVTIRETATTVSIALESGVDPSSRQGASSQACSAVGQAYVTQVLLASELGSKTVNGPSNQGVVERL